MEIMFYFISEIEENCETNFIYGLPYGRRVPPVKIDSKPNTTETLIFNIEFDCSTDANSGFIKVLSLTIKFYE